MQLQEIFDQLSVGEFSQLSIGGAPAGVIDESNHVRVVAHLNLALTAIFTRFHLKEKTLDVPIVSGTTVYPLNPGDLLKITGVLTEGGTELPLNDASKLYNCVTTALNTLKIPESVVEQGMDLPDELKTSKLVAVYRANHPTINAAGDFDPRTVDIELPRTHLEALLFNVASRVHNPIGMTNEFHAGNSYYAKYEHACQLLEGQGIQIDQGSQNTRLGRGGWV